MVKFSTIYPCVTSLAYTLQLIRSMDSAPILSGTAELRLGPRPLGRVPYEVEISSANGQATIVRFAQKPPARDGQTVHLTLEDGRMLDCEVLDASSFCAVVGEGPYDDRRTRPR
jgi:hypothetical protein